MNLEKLKEPFPYEDIEWRVSRSGGTNDKPWAFCLAYINARAVMDRLDEVVGPDKWKDRYWKDGNAIMCGISIKIGEEWVEKVDGSEESDIEAVKGGISGAFKRAAVKWGISRYLYNLTESFAQIVPKGSKNANYAKTKEGVQFYWAPPVLPDWALPKKENKPETVQSITNGSDKAKPFGQQTDPRYAGFNKN